MSYDREFNDSDDKFFLGFMSVVFVLMGGLAAVMAGSLVVAIWQAGFMNFLVWSGIFAFIAFASRLVYRLLLKNDWLDKL